MIKTLTPKDTEKNIKRDINCLLDKAFLYAIEDDILEMQFRPKIIQKTKRTDYGEVIETVRINSTYFPLVKIYNAPKTYDQLGKIKESIKNGGLIEIII